MASLVSDISTNEKDNTNTNNNSNTYTPTQTPNKKGSSNNQSPAINSTIRTEQININSPNVTITATSSSTNPTNVTPTIAIDKNVTYENLVLGHASSRGVALKSASEEKVWSTLETRLYGDPNRQQTMPGLYVPHRNFILVNAPTVEQEPEPKEVEPKKEAPSKPMTQTRKSWIKNLMEKKHLQKKKKRDAETFVSDSEHSEVDSPLNDRTKFRRSGFESKFDSSASEMSDSGYHSTTSTRKKVKGTRKSRNRKIVKARRNNRSGNYSGKKSKNLTDTELDRLDNFDFDADNDHLNLDIGTDATSFLESGFGNNNNNSNSNKPSRKKKSSKKNLKKMEKYWQQETQKAEDDLSKFVLDFSTSLKEKEGSGELVLESFFEQDDDDENGIVIDDNELANSFQFQDRSLMTSLDVDSSLTSSLKVPNDGTLAGSIQAMSLEQSDFNEQAANIAMNLSMSDSGKGTEESINFDLQKSLIGIIETSTESVAFDELQSSTGTGGRRSSLE